MPSLPADINVVPTLDNVSDFIASLCGHVSYEIFFSVSTSIPNHEFVIVIGAE
jgi:hypothetical protein